MPDNLDAAPPVETYDTFERGGSRWVVVELYQLLPLPFPIYEAVFSTLQEPPRLVTNRDILR